ncbi:hypothetical protein SAMN03159304_03436 [Pseudomonas sp. NFACC24-1]|uniref:hypothetical protein n=1 Tax=Pseudomonas sp. NFACC24-1 TaxID=1566189 RepID=UPI0008E1B4BA|nr:hypothetical protein [Pseudomonas sp. NFACC24-1]SFO45616.1 hypothetical protein SAMN03159304_03436 [Pseudomonas sp. NFACC24-1]
MDPIAPNLGRILPTPQIELRHRHPTADINALERGEAPVHLPDFTSRARAHVTGLSQAFHRDYLAPAGRATGALWGSAKEHGVALGNKVGRGAKLALSDSMANLPSGRTTLAAAGHTVQQMVNCGAPTYLRELAFMHAYSALNEGLAKKSPGGMLALQAAVSLATIATQLYVRQPRLERLAADSSDAVRGHFALSEAKWNALPPDKQDTLRLQMKRDSRNITRNQVVAEALYLGMGAMGAARGDGALSARVLATQLRDVIYALSRETMQATFSMTAPQDDTKTYGVDEDNMPTLGWAYGAMTLSMGFMLDSISEQVLPPGQTLTSPALLGPDQQPLLGEALAASIQSLAGTRAAFNTVVATLDNHLQRHFDTRQVGTNQELKPSLPLKDYGRVLDQSPARVAWASLAGAINMATGEALRGKVPPALSGFLGNMGTAAAMGLAYRTVNQTFQSHASVRKAVDKQAATAAAGQQQA